MLSLDIDALTRARNASEASKTIGIRALPKLHAIAGSRPRWRRLDLSIDSP